MSFSHRSSNILWTTICLVLLLVACQSQPPVNDSGYVAVTAIPTLDTTDADSLCEAVETNWGTDWSIVIRALEALEELETTCNDEASLDETFYAAYVGYGVYFEQNANETESIRNYLLALEYNSNGSEAVEALERLGEGVPTPLENCDQTTINEALSQLAGYIPTSGDFVQIRDNDFMLSEQLYPVYGINYYPRDYPYHRFLTEMEVDRVDLELQLMRDVGINTLRIFLRHEDLFQCPGDGAIPIPENFARLDEFIQLAAPRGYKLILVLNQDDDLHDHPLYDEATEHVLQQMSFVAERYHDEPAIMAYDLRDGGDYDYSGDAARFSREIVLQWLFKAAQTMRQTAPNHLITAGWDDDSEVTVPLVDFVSFQHFSDVDSLRQEIAILTAATDKPILLATIGYSTYEMDELAQRHVLQQAIDAVENTGLAGWVIWTAFDYPLSVVCAEPGCPGDDGAEVHFGLWNTSYFPKRALDVVRIVTGTFSDEEEEGEEDG